MSTARFCGTEGMVLEGTVPGVWGMVLGVWSVGYGPGSIIQGVWWEGTTPLPPHLNRLIDTCGNITFPQLRLPVVIRDSPGDSVTMGLSSLSLPPHWYPFWRSAHLNPDGYLTPQLEIEFEFETNDCKKIAASPHQRLVTILLQSLVLKCLFIYANV